MTDKVLGHATAYAYYKAGGGTMTEAEFTEFMADFGTASQTAVEAAQAALASKNAAQTAATTATNKASEATTAATTATNKAAEAQADADAAALDASQAMSAASTATTKATEATTAAATATSAKDDAVSANTAAQSAKTAAQTAQTDAETAAASVQSSAAQIATNTDDITQLKSEITDLDESLTTGLHPIDLDLTTSPATRFVSKKYYLNAVSLPISFNCSNNSYSYYIGYYKSDDTFISTTAWQKGTYTVTTANIPAETAYFIMTCKADDEHSLSEAEKDYYSCWNEYVFYTDIAELKKILSTAFVDGTNGSDGNNGLSMNAPFKTITKAINSGARTIRCAKGTYSERIALTNVNDLTIMPYNYGTFDGTSYADKITLDGINTRPYLLTMANCSNITLIGLETINFTNSGIKAENCSNIKLINCSSGNQYGSYQYGIAFELINTDADFDTCISHDVLLDGFNIHGYGVTAFRNCIAYNCGDDGISHHDACVGYITGGEYYNCGKGGIASPTYGSYIDISGAYCHDNKYGIYAVSSSARRKSKTNISNCASANNDTADIYIDYADAVGWNNQYTTKTVGTNGTFTEI